MTTNVTFQARINGQEVTATVSPRTLLVDFLRDHLGLTGTHVGCTFEGVCGACTVQLDDEAVKSCMLLAGQISGHQVLTVEGLAQGGSPHPLQAAFQDAHALQCGYCTPGILMNMSDFIGRNEAPTDDEIRAALVGNLCRCTGYSHIVEAVRNAAHAIKARKGAAA
jgi:aerobic-type carbon monoxide dehydrogenase small subunit (CoxS/CutS family)